MTKLPSRRALLAVTRVLSTGTEKYRCPNCIRLGRAAPNPARHDWSGVRQFGVSAIRKADKEDPEENEIGADLLQFQLSGRRDDGTRVPAPPVDVEQIGRSQTEPATFSTTTLSPEIEQVEAGLEISEMAIEDMEDELMDIQETEDPYVEESAAEDEFAPWYMRQEGEISEEDYASIENLINSDSNQQPKIHQSEIMHSRPQQDDVELVPWYLREQESDTSLIPEMDLPPSQLEKYPDIPSDGPPLLQPLISRLFYDHHLQNIILLDLRNRDPPPAWGSNTIMILATVRSERQLASVAEATAKWLKTTASVHPRIDGLPKKESVIIKRRRLRRKSLRKPGYLIAAPRPTTWVSMYTGYHGLLLQLFTAEGREEYDLEGLWGDKRIVDAGALDMKPRKMRPGGMEEDERIETSAPSSGKKPVWEKKVDKERRKWEKMKEEKASKKRWTKQEKDAARSRRGQDFSIWGASGGNFPSRGKSGDRQQRRQLHSQSSASAKYQEVRIPEFSEESEDAILLNTKKRHPQWKKSDSEATPQKQTAWWGASQFTLPRMSDTVLPSSVYDQLLSSLKDLPPFSPRDASMDRIAQTIALQGDRRAAEKLSNLCASNDPGSLLLLAHFGNLSRYIRMSQSVDYPHVGKFTMDPFPETGFQWAFDFFLRDMPIRPTAHHWQLAVLFYLNLQMHDPKLYSIIRLRDILLLPISQGISIPISTFHLILNHIAVSSPENRDVIKESKPNASVFHENVHARLRTMNNFLIFMKKHFAHDYKHDEEVYLALYKAACQPYPTLSQLSHDLHLPLPRHHNDYRRILIKHYFERHLPISPEFFVLELLQFAHMRKWRSFLKRWNWTRVAGVGKDIDMWCFFWFILARGRNEEIIRYALRENYDEMMDEGGHLCLNRDVARGIERCLEIVDPMGREFQKQRKVVTSMLESLD